jgi:hypothetical protein
MKGESPQAAEKMVRTVEHQSYSKYQFEVATLEQEAQGLFGSLPNLSHFA